MLTSFIPFFSCQLLQEKQEVMRGHVGLLLYVAKESNTQVKLEFLENHELCEK